MSVDTHVHFDIITNAANKKIIKAIKSNIKNTEYSKKGIPQNAGVDDPGGKSNFIRIFGEDFSSHIDFDKHKFDFARVKEDQSGPLLLLLNSGYPEGFQEKLTQFLGKNDPNIFIYSYFNSWITISGVRFSALTKDCKIYSKGFTVVEDNGSISAHIYDSPVSDNFYPTASSVPAAELEGESSMSFQMKKTAEMISQIARELPHQLDSLKKKFGKFKGVEW
jgi:hypothetical protein